jgi:alpha-1,2-mannosyltransferase
MLYALKCLFTQVPRVVIDTTGAPFAAPVWKLFGGCRVIQYTHYPFISTDMLHDVQTGQKCVNNTQNVAKSKLKTRVKILYYKLLCFFYGLAGKFVDLCFVNSSWTKAHIRAIYGREPTLLYPPCDCERLSQAPAAARDPNLIISVGQYRPEKDHDLQLEVMEILKQQSPDTRLAIVGGTRDAGDCALADQIESAIAEKRLNATVLRNIPFEELQQLYRSASVGIHTMRNEHFGICVVEYIAAGLLPVAHNSAGPREDILPGEAAYLAERAPEYAQKVLRALALPEREREDEVARLQRRIAAFSVGVFQEAFWKALRGQ